MDLKSESNLDHRNVVNFQFLSHRHYSTHEDIVEVHDVIFTLLEWISWDDIHIQSGLGNGQLQFKSNALNLELLNYTKKKGTKSNLIVEGVVNKVSSTPSL